ncbi:hypothetical protein [uncultured Draconibacterium sp.]|uniref:hypothetical protein n=1 Tax=uncultured Draconibacterium sp. TaxID=1573823 RepID=UPI0029C966D7|nr:hypothetical protein [uncultured Draconibacterium sp.]
MNRRNILNIKPKVLLSASLLTIGLTGSFMFHEKVSLPLVLFSFVLIVFIRKLKIYNEDILMFFCFSLMLLFGLNGITISGLIYILAFGYAYFVYTKSAVIFSSKVDVYKVLLILTFLTNFFIFYEFTTKNFIPSLFIELPRPRVMEMDALFLGVFQRARGFAEEPAHMGLFYEFVVPILFMKYRKEKPRIVFITFLITSFLAVFCIFSSFTIVMLGLYFLLFILFKTRLKLKIRILIVAIAAIIGIAFYHPEFFNYLDLAVDAISNKILMKGGASATDRSIRFNEGIQIVLKYPLGIGAMNMSKISPYPSSLNLYLDLLMFFGPFVLTSFLIYIGVIVYKAFKLDIWSLFASTLIVLAHYFIIANFWYPYLWFLFGLIQYNYSALKSSKQKIAELPYA